jgi:hypothetical protein
MRTRPALFSLLFPIAALLAAQQTADVPAMDRAVGHVVWQYDTSGLSVLDPHGRGGYVADRIVCRNILCV